HEAGTADSTVGRKTAARIHGPGHRLSQVVRVGAASTIDRFRRSTHYWQEPIRNRNSFPCQRIERRRHPAGLSFVFPAQIQFKPSMDTAKEDLGFNCRSVTVFN